jgi:hypothetical protein
LLTHSGEAWQRRRGQTDAGSWAARITARICGAMLLVLVASSWAAAADAIAATGGHASDPAPQKAPTSGGSSQPSPDPAPGAASTSPEHHQSTVTRPAIQVPIVTTPARTVVTPANTVSAPATKTVNSSPPPRQTARRSPPSRVRAARAEPPRHARSQATQLSFPLTLPRDLLLLPDKALGGGETGHRDGVLLLLSSIAMAVLAVASFALLRRLRRLDVR